MADNVDEARLAALKAKHKARADKPGFAQNVAALQREIDELEAKLKAAEGGA